MFVTVEDSMSVVHRSQGAHEPASPQLRSEPTIVCELAAATLGSPASWIGKNWRTSYDAVREEIQAVIPGFDDFNRRVRQPDGFVLPNGPRDGANSPPRAARRTSWWTRTPIGSCNGEYLMMTIRTHDQFNTTIYGLEDRYRGIHGERRVVLMHAEDMAREGLQAKQRLDLVNTFGGTERTATDFFVIPYAIAKGCVATYFPRPTCWCPWNRRRSSAAPPPARAWW
jgi:anaerobic selenocysteine-containing dehydrogenase